MFLSRLGPALRHRNYRLFFAGQSVSLAGTWITRFATVWMVYRLTGSPLMLGLVAFFGQAPAAVLAPLAGVLVDRWDRRRAVIATQIASMLQSAALALFALTGWMTVWHLLALGAVQAVINAFDTVSRQSFLGEMIEDRADLPNAVALNSLMVNGARMLGPVIAALLVGVVGEGVCFSIDAASSIPVIASLFAMRVAPRAMPSRTGRVFGEMKEGLAYAAAQPVLRAVLVLFATTSVLVGSYSTLLPVVAGDTLHGGPHTLGALMGAAGLGALLGAVLLAGRTAGDARRSARAAKDASAAPTAAVFGAGRVLAACSLVVGVALIALEAAHSVRVATPILFVIGACWMVQSASTMTLVQTLVAPEKAGRVMSLIAVGFFGGAPLGALVEGFVAKHLGAVHALALAGAGSLVAGMVFARSLPRLREAARRDACASTPSLDALDAPPGSPLTLDGLSAKRIGG